MPDKVMPIHPCLTCGACCAHFSVSFYWAEADDAPGGTVPRTLTEDLGSLLCCMKGTNSSWPRCAALAGEIGRAVRCTIYDHRPSPCREFAVDWADGMLHYEEADLARCTRARAAWGLPPLFDAESARPPDWRGGQSAA